MKTMSNDHTKSLLNNLKNILRGMFPRYLTKQNKTIYISLPKDWLHENGLIREDYRKEKVGLIPKDLEKVLGVGIKGLVLFLPLEMQNEALLTDIELFILKQLEKNKGKVYRGYLKDQFITEKSSENAMFLKQAIRGLEDKGLVIQEKNYLFERNVYEQAKNSEQAIITANRVKYTESQKYQKNRKN